MLLADSNIWIAQAFAEHDFHAVISEWFLALPTADTVCFCRSTQQSFLRLLTTKSIFEKYNLAPRNSSDAWDLYRRFRADPRIGFVEEPPGTEALWEQFTLHTSPTPKLWMDAYLAAFAIRGGLQFVTTDSGFQQFPGLNAVILKLIP